MPGRQLSARERETSEAELSTWASVGRRRRPGDMPCACRLLQRGHGEGEAWQEEALPPWKPQSSLSNREATCGHFPSGQMGANSAEWLQGLGLVSYRRSLGQREPSQPIRNLSRCAPEGEAGWADSLARPHLWAQPDPHGLRQSTGQTPMPRTHRAERKTAELAGPRRTEAKLRVVST